MQVDQQVINFMPVHIPVRGEEPSDWSATSGAVFLASKLLQIVIRRHQEIGDITVYLGDGEGGRCPLPSQMTTGWMLLLGSSSAKNLPQAASAKCPS